MKKKIHITGTNIRLTIFALLLTGGYSIKAQNVCISGDGSVPLLSAMLEVKSTTSGFLVPRMTAAQKTAILTPATGLLIYQTDAPAGFWFYNGASWTQLGAGTAWNLTGNAGTVAGTNFIGTTDAIDWVVKTANLERIRVLSGGNVGINNSVPSGKFEVSGTSVFNSGSSNLDGANIAFLNNSAKLLLGWNRTAGGGETDFITNRGAGSTGGFRFYDYTNAGVENVLVTMLGNGNVGIGDVTPANLFTVGNNDVFQVGTDGDIDRIKNVPLSWPTSNTVGTLLNDGTGNLSWAGSSWEKVLDITLTNATTYTLSGLDGNDDVGYKIIMMGSHANPNADMKNCWIQPNADGNVANYSYGMDAYWLYRGGYGWSYDCYDLGGIFIWSTDANAAPNYVESETIISSFTGSKRHGVTRYSLGLGGNNIVVNLSAGVWDNTATNITSLVFNWEGPTGFTGRLIIYAMH